MICVEKLSRPVVVPREDPGWLKAQFGSFHSALDLAHDRFPHFAEWPEFDPTKTYAVVWFEGDTLSNWEAVDKRLTEEGYGPDRRTYPFHLASEVVPQVVKLWKQRKEGKGPGWIYASDGKSVWRNDDGRLYLPYVLLEPGCCGVYARYVGYEFRDFEGFLVVCE